VIGLIAIMLYPPIFEVSVQMNTNSLLTLSHATERDIDLILVEEMKCSRAFVDWFANLVALRMKTSIPFRQFTVAHSVRRTHNRREIDISLSLWATDTTTTLLVENKLDTSPQPLQAESYRDEANTMISRGEANAVFTILVAPQDYALTSRLFAEKFDCFISYEQVAEFLSQRISMESGELRARIHHRSELLHQAISKARRGYQAVPLMQVEQFNSKYVTLLRESGIDLPPGPSMLKDGRPGESKTMIFSPNALPKWPFLPQTRLVHQLREGNANINFYGWGRHFSRLAGFMAPYLVGTGYRPVPTINKRVDGKSGLMIVVDTPAVDNLLGFDEQREAVLQGMRVTAELRKWFLGNKLAIEEWANAVENL
jgi:hypothetical protein